MDILKNDIERINKEILLELKDPLKDTSTQNFLMSGSKYIRSKLALLYTKVFQKEDERIYKILAAGELIHNASLLHDDVIDEADTRRNKTTISKKFSPKISILLGDYLLAYAIEKLLSIKSNEIIEVFKSCTQKMCLGEINQFLHRGEIPNLEEYIEICENKTGLLFSAILESCAILLSLDRNSAQNLGKLFGTYFQIKNDINKASREIDKRNKISTAIDILGIEKTQILLDNYLEKMRILLEKFPNNIYREKLEELIKNYDN